MPKPDAGLVLKWRRLAEEGYLYAEIARMYASFSVDQVRHYCLGHTGRKLGGPVQRVDRWYGSNVWLRGSNSPTPSSLKPRPARSWTTGTRTPTGGEPRAPSGPVAWAFPVHGVYAPAW